MHAETSLSVEALEKSEEYQIGLMVKSIQKALNNPEASGSLETTIKYGIDTG